MPQPPRSLTRKAHEFAALMAMLWVFFAIGAWYASRFDAFLGLPAERPAILFGATFAVWFVSLFAYIGMHLLKQAFSKHHTKKERAERYV